MALLAFYLQCCLSLSWNALFSYCLWILCHSMNSKENSILHLYKICFFQFIEGHSLHLSCIYLLTLFYYKTKASESRQGYTRLVTVFFCLAVFKSSCRWQYNQMFLNPVSLNELQEKVYTMSTKIQLLAWSCDLHTTAHWTYAFSQRNWTCVLVNVSCSCISPAHFNILLMQTAIIKTDINHINQYIYIIFCHRAEV